MVLSDRHIREQLESGGIVIDPLGEGCIQPSSVDLHVDRLFRVFRNDTTPFIDPKSAQEDLTELVEVEDGNAFILHPGEFVLGSTLERVALGNDLVARLEGKALAFDTRVPTPAGWKTMAGLDVGDKVFDPDGRPVPIVAATELLVGRPCRQVTFSDGTKVIADADHQWEVQTKYDRQCGHVRVMTTDAIARSLTIPHSRTKEYAYHVPQARAVEYPEKDLPVDPYVFGAWIGDGTSTAAEITCADPEIVAQIDLAGYAVHRTAKAYGWRIGGTATRVRDAGGRYTGAGTLQGTLREMGVLGDKRIPREYMEGSVEQRRALLEGLMDTDGYIDTRGRCDLTTVKRALAHQYCELIASLGHRPVIAEKPAKLYGKHCGTRYEVTFTPSRLVFRLPRKRFRQVIGVRRHHSRAIVDVREVPSVPVRCIEVGSERGAFLVTTSFIPTHNSSLGRLGLLIHSTAGFVDAGWDGHLTLELSNVANLPIAIYPGMKIGQISFLQMSSEAENPYGGDTTASKYKGQQGPTPSRYYLNFPEDERH
jgi:deoxycytidine triphosphate deaminase